MSLKIPNLREHLRTRLHLFIPSLRKENFEQEHNNSLLSFNVSILYCLRLISSSSPNFRSAHNDLFCIYIVLLMHLANQIQNHYTAVHE